MAWRPKLDEALTLDGEWCAYKGEKQFAFKSARLNVPTHPRDQLHYVCARTPGLGPAMEDAIWTAFGANWQKAGEGSVARLSGKLYANFKLQIEALAEQAEQVKIVSALMSKGATMNMAQSAWEKWGVAALGVVNSDCYHLAELPGYGFRDVDRVIRRTYGIEDADPRRIRAAIVYTLRRITDRGDTVVAWQDLYAQSVALLGGYEDLISDCTGSLFEEGALKAFPKSEGVSLAADWKAENSIWNYIEKKETA